MPYTAQQHRLFEFVAHGGTPREKTSLTPAVASRLASEGVKPEHDHAATAKRAKAVMARLK